ncbi:uncharacterized protein LOC134227165 [Armigeres subalbatus]|uniref:uncharacterized protein LOC134227165 n=1 Tax=Armigeres subalbatus TaxID=124917 RepID=UPI002ED31FCB
MNAVQNQANANTTSETFMLITTQSADCEPGPSGSALSSEPVQNAERDISLNANQQTIMDNQQIIVNNQIKLMQAIAKLQTGVDLIIENNMFGNQQPKDTNKILLQPVSSIAEMNALEQSLKESGSADKYIKNMSFICGTDGKASGMDSCYKLIDYFVTREFMHTCSWTGNTKLTDEHISMNTMPDLQIEAVGKVPLKFYCHFRSLFLKLIRLSDKDFTEVKCDEFFKRVMKNSKARLQAKSSSKHKNRPCNLKYKSHKPTGNQNPDQVPEENTVVAENLQPSEQLQNKI